MTLRPPTATCRAIDEMRLPWPYTRSIWRHNPIFCRAATPARGEGGTVNHCALDVLEDVLGWYRINRTRDEATGLVLSEARLFDGEALQKDYATWADDLGYTKRQVQDAVALLHDAGLVRRWCAVQISGYGVKVGNAVFVEPRPDVVRVISRPAIAPQGGDPPLSYKRERSPVQMREGARMDGRGITSACATLKTPKSARKTQEAQQQQPLAGQPVDLPQDAASDVVVAGNPGRKSAWEHKGEKDHPSADDEDIQPTPEAALFKELVKEGMGEAQARQAASENLPKAEYQLASLRHALLDEKLTPTDRGRWLYVRGRWLYVAIRDGYGPTKGYARHLEAERKAQEAAAGRAAAQARQAARADENARPTEPSLAERLALLPPEEQAALRQRARNAILPFMRLRCSGEAKNDGRAKLIGRHLRTLLAGGEVEDHGEWQLGDDSEATPPEPSCWRAPSGGRGPDCAAGAGGPPDKTRPIS